MRAVLVVKADESLCQGYANCVESSPDTFDLGDDGTVDVLRGEVGDDELADIEDAVGSCPVSALMVTRS